MWYLARGVSARSRFVWRIRISWWVGIGAHVGRSATRADREWGSIGGPYGSESPGAIGPGDRPRSGGPQLTLTLTLGCKVSGRSSRGQAFTCSTYGFIHWGLVRGSFRRVIQGEVRLGGSSVKGRFFITSLIVGFPNLFPAELASTHSHFPLEASPACPLTSMPESQQDLGQ